jgi:hypothetical protein
MPPGEFESTIPASERPRAYALARSATDIVITHILINNVGNCYCREIRFRVMHKSMDGRSTDDLPMICGKPISVPARDIGTDHTYDIGVAAMLMVSEAFKIK